MKACLTKIALAMFLLVTCLIAEPSSAFAAEKSDAITPADTSSPRATLKSFIESCNELHQFIKTEKYLDRNSPKHHAAVTQLLDCLDLSEIPQYARESAAGEAAVCLKEILDRVELPPEEEIPDTAAIKAAGGPEKLSRWQIPGTRITIARVAEGPQRHEYLFTAGTVGRAPTYYNDIKSSPYRTTGPAVSEDFHEWFISAPGKRAVGEIVDRLPDWTREMVFGQVVWKWFGLLVTLAITVVLMAIASRLQHVYVTRWRDRRLFLYCLTLLFPIVAMCIPSVFQHVARFHLTLRGTLLYVVSFSADMTTLAAAIVVIFAVANRIASAIIASPQINPQGLDAQVTRIIAKLASLVVSAIVFLEGGKYLGIPLTTLLAGAGVGGLALALAAQDTLKTILGTITLMADKPFRVGERIIFEKYDGVVEDIGLRSTKIRLLTGHQAIIPNDELARTDIENVGRRPYIRRLADLHIPLNTPREKIQKAVEIIRTALDNHEGMEADFPPRVFFNEFNSDSFNIRIIYWYHPPNYWDFLAFSEKLNLEIFRAFEEQEIPFSLPLRVAHTSVNSQEKPIEVRLLEERHGL